MKRCTLTLCTYLKTRDMPNCNFRLTMETFRWLDVLDEISSLWLI